MTTNDEGSTGVDEERWHVSPEHVRMPRTVSEARASLDMAVGKVAKFTAFIEKDPSVTSRYATIRYRWEERVTELEWVLERFLAGEAAPSLDLAYERAKHQAEVTRLNAGFAVEKTKLCEEFNRERVKMQGAILRLCDEVKTLKEAPAARAPFVAVTPISEHRAESYRKHIADLTRGSEAKTLVIERLKAEVAVLKSGAPPTPEATEFQTIKDQVKRLRTALRNARALGLEMANAFIEQGATVTPLVGLFVDDLRRALRPAQIEQWRLLELPRYTAASAVPTDPEGDGD